MRTEVGCGWCWKPTCNVVLPIFATSYDTEFSDVTTSLDANDPFNTVHLATSPTTAIVKL